MKKQKKSNLCPCGSHLLYEACCAPWHREGVASDAETLMRSRYSAYVLKLEDYLLATWHVSTRPSALHLSESNEQKWIGLTVKHYELIDSVSATVEFIAFYKLGGGKAERLHEISYFRFEHGCWFYVDGKFPSSI